MPPKADREKPDGAGKGRGRGAGRGKGAGRGAAAGPTSDTAKRLQELDGGSVEAESNFEILRAQRAQARKGVKAFKDIRENEGVDEDDPLNSIDDGIRLEPFNMRREMREGHFDESGFYVLNKDEEKKVTDAWLDTVDQAERHATFKAADKQNKALDTAANRLSAMAKNLGPDSEGEEEDEDDKEDAEGDKEKAAEESKKTAEEEAQEDEQDEATIIDMLEELIAFLQPLESPATALARIRRGEARAREPVLKTRAAMRKARAEAAQPSASAGRGDARPKRKKFNEWGGYEEAGAAEAAPAPTPDAKETTNPEAEGPPPETVAQEAPAKVQQEPAATEEKGKVETELAKVEAARAAAAAAVAAERVAAAESAKAAAAKSSVATAAAVAEAAARAAADERAMEEAAKAFAAEMKMSRSIARALVPEQGPEAAAIVNLNSEETRDVREKAMPKLPEEVPADGPPRPGQRRKAAPVDDEEAAKRVKMSRLTDLCDRLLERGVLVYDSAREILAIDVRQRKGEDLTGEEKTETEKTETPQAEPSPGDKRPAPQSAPEVQFTNKRFKAGAGDATVVEATDANSAGPATSSSLFWQLRWGHNPSEINGPFDSVTMQGWMMQGCFSDERPAEFRQCNGKNEPQEQCWHKWDKIDFGLYI